jgi:hypothetical protein
LRRAAGCAKLTRMNSRLLVVLLLWATTGGASEPALKTLVVSFGSACCGTDHDAEERLSQALAGSKATQRSVSWGKEGEVDVCLDLAPLTENERAELFAKVTAAVAKGKYVTVKQNAVCRAGR